MFDVVFKRLPDFKPKYIISDFEIGAINAIVKFLPDSTVHGCFFHLCQSVWRHIQSVGLQERYVSDAQFAVNVRQLLALAFVPPEDIVRFFNDMCATEFWMEKDDDEDSMKLQKVLHYFECTYIGELTRLGKRRTVQFPPTMWSVYTLTRLGTNFDLC